jgi:hypothetical protein
VEEEMDEDIEPEEVKANILYSSTFHSLDLPPEKASNLLKNAKVLRDGREVVNETDVVDLSERIHVLLSEQ